MTEKYQSREPVLNINLFMNKCQWCVFFPVLIKPFTGKYRIGIPTNIYFIYETPGENYPCG